MWVDKDAIDPVRNNKNINIVSFMMQTVLSGFCLVRTDVMFTPLYPRAGRCGMRSGERLIRSQKLSYLVVILLVNRNKADNPVTSIGDI